MFSNLRFSLGLGKILLSKFKYRDRATIIGHILESICRAPAGKTKTSIMRDANLNFDQANKYLHLLVLCDVVRATDPINSHELNRYKLTQKGFSLLRDFQLWNLVLETFNRRPV